MPVTIGNLRATWANTIVYTGIGLNVNATAYDANSALLDLKLNSNSLIKLTSNGVLYVNGYPIGVSSNTNVGPAFDKANTANDIAVSAFIAANAAGGTGISAAFDKANSANIIASQAFDKANSANVLAYNTGIGANAFAAATVAGANTAVGGGANTYLLAVIAGANTAVGAGANAFAAATVAGANTAVGAGANAFAAATVAGANTAVGAGANSYLLITIAGANTAVGGGANAFSAATIAGANSAVGAGANTYLIAIITGANAAVGAGANAFTSATVAGANTAVGAGANAFTSATVAGANTAVGAGANAFAAAIANTIAILAFDRANTANLVPVGNTLTNSFTLRSTRNKLNFIQGTNVTINVDDDSSGDRANITISATAGSDPVAGFAFDRANTANLVPVGNTLSNAFTLRSTRNKLNFVPGTNITINVDDDSAGDRVNVTIAASGTSGASVNVGASAPVSASNGDLWWSTTYGTLFVFYNDGTSSQWVESTPGSPYANIAQTTAIASFERANTLGCNVQTFTTSGTWTKPTGYSANSRVLIEAWGAGGSGARNSTAGNAGGGGGGGYNFVWKLLSALGSTETATVGQGGASRTGSNQAGAAGGDSSLGSHLAAYGGGGGALSIYGGGHGGGQLSAGATATGSYQAGSVGNPRIVVATASAGADLFYQGTGRTTDTAVASFYGPYIGFMHGGGAGASNAVGGAQSVWGGGGGGANNASGGTSSFGGNGGAGAQPGSGGVGVAGSEPGGGGGTGTTTSGAGANGRIIVTVFGG